MKNLGLKLLSLLLACVLWWYVSLPRREQARERIVTASLSLVGVPPSLVITTPDIRSSVSVRVRGRKSDLRLLGSQSLEASADLSSINKPGEVEITIRPQHINVPENIEVVSIEPNRVRFRVEQLRQRAVLIRPYLEGTAPAGYIVGTATAEPSLALCSGPASQIMKLAEVTTERIIMTGRKGTFVQSVGVISDSPLVRVISPLTTQVTVPVLAEVGPALPSATDTAGTMSDER
ncbi:MAG TPA: CdaR family protein [Thermoanaerobaculia bacterium]|jgi:YbbR domain-containing protein|nr:CdaR family protein [Thermoanaerobaculia bacterium]